MAENSESGGAAAAYSFIGEVAASSTHEIKNELAVINEQSRLVGEMLALGRDGEVDVDTLARLIERVVVRVTQADQAVRRLNAFAHSMEEGGPSCDAAGSLALMAEMFRRPAGLKGVEVEARRPQEMKVGLARLDCERLIWAGMKAALAAAASGGRLVAELAEQEGCKVLKLVSGAETAPDTAAFAQWEAAGVSVAWEGGALLIRLPAAGG